MAAGSRSEEERFAAEARRILKAEMARRDITFRKLAEALAADGDDDVEAVQTLINKINRGRFSFAFLIRVARAIGVDAVSLAPLKS